MNYFCKFLFCLFIQLVFCESAQSVGKYTFRVATYNVENLFDLKHDSNDYKAYVPNSEYGWNKKIAERKYANISKVISGLNSDIIALQEVESYRALTCLKACLAKKGVDYRFLAIADSNDSVIKCAVLSKFKIIRQSEIDVGGSDRPIFKVVSDVFGNKLIIYINHWKSKRHPESTRIKAARVLKSDIESLLPETEYMILGDLNSDYNEFITFKKNEKLNDSFGLTGINHILKTIKASEPVYKTQLNSSSCRGCLYNLWLELEAAERWSYIFSDKKNSLDTIIIPGSLYDRKKITYIDNSFNRYKPGYLMKGRFIFRWQRSEKGRHTGEGFSDHLPVYAEFKVVKPAR